MALQHSASSASCTLQYPERFEAAVDFVQEQGEGLPEESKLLLYALQQQATVGPCNESKPWGWDVVRNAKWQSWKQLGDMSSTEAMRLYVRTLEEEQPEWWSAMSANGKAAEGPEGGEAEQGEQQQAQQQPPEAAAAPAPVATAQPSMAPASSAAGEMVISPKSRSVAEVVVEGSWVSPYIASSKRPPPRYEHAVALVGSQLYIIGGSCGGRYLNDAWALNLENLTWSQVTNPKRQPSSLPPSTNGDGGEAEVPPPPPQLPPIAGLAAVTWNGNVICIGGHTRAKDVAEELPVRMLDTKAGVWSTLEVANSELAQPRGGHSATLIGSKVYVFGGEDTRRRSLGDLLVLDLNTMEWSVPQTSGKPPAARSAHSASAYQNRFLLLFGGGSVAHCYDDLWMLDTETMVWSEVPAEGPVPPPRAGHAASLLGSTWYIVGGGNNAAGCADMYSLDLAHLGQGPVQWTLVGNTPVESAIASEGLSLLSVPMAGCMVSFGGYNGRYHNSVHVYRPEGYVVVKVPQRAASAEAAKPAPVNGSKGAEPAAPQPSIDLDKKISELEAARKEAAAAKESVAHEMAIMRRQLASAQAAQAEAEKAHESSKAALSEEQSKVLKLEVEVAELRQQLGRMQELERELEQYRQQAAEQAAQRKGSGIWGYISGEK